MAVPDDLAARLRVLAADVDAALAAVPLPSAPEALYAPVRYVLAGGGKRVRPLLVYASGALFGADSAALERAA